MKIATSDIIRNTMSKLPTDFLDMPVDQALEGFATDPSYQQFNLRFEPSEEKFTFPKKAPKESM